MSLLDVDAFIFGVPGGIIVIIDMDSTRNIPNIEKKVQFDLIKSQ